MSQMTFSSISGLTDIVDAQVLAATDIVTDDSLVKIAQNAQGGAVRSETIPMGFYKHGDTIGTPQSPVDGYPYSRSEVTYSYQMFSTRAPANGFVSGQGIPPVIASSQPSNYYWKTCDIDDSTGIVSIEVGYFVQGVSETDVHDGIIKAYAVCQRQSVAVAS
jgi:hypothetical protein